MDEKAKRFVSKSRRNKPKHGSKGKVTSKLRSRCRKGGQKKSSTASKSNSAISPGVSNERNLEKNLEKNHPLEKREIEKKESEKESDKKKEEEKKKIEKRREREFKEDKEPDTDSDHDADLSLKKSHVAVPTRKGKPQKVAIKHNDVDEKETERLLKKLNDIKTEPARPQVTLDEKSKILMDRVEKKPYPAKYAKRNKWALLVEEDGEFFKPTPFTKAGSSTIVPVEDTYDYVPKLADVQKMEGENVFQTTMMGEVPYWGVYLDPEEHDLDGIEPPISVGSEHVMAYHKKELPLKTPKCSKLTLDEFQPSSMLFSRDEKFFHAHLVFSNTVRSLINVQARVPVVGSKSQMRSDDDDVEEEREESTQPDDIHVTIPLGAPTSWSYERSRPILSARKEKDRLLTSKKLDAKSPTPSKISKIEEEQKQQNIKIP
ncbi:hypothetical protein L3Y34_016103 [Caenorhabditis briggsae]|uniref:Uncharacterized protein n=1 Tax=Caenorhabditis briggsae TaxID=6238 RepID=A0AAE9DY49_CAEBR|nr:hypothetical protein L3Y34_016103 [Caenorhabditis briggsae]